MSKRRGRSRPGGARRAQSAILFATLGLVGAFIVSAVAGLGKEDSGDEGGLAPRALEGPTGAASIRVEVLNGAGTPGLARQATGELRSAGFDVVFFGNAGSFGRGRSVVLDRTGHPERARAVAAALGIDSVATAVDSALVLEVTVVLGDDWPPTSELEPGWRERLRGLIPGGSGGDPGR